jgi:alpha-D-xyloside xylohydrolase
MFGPDYFIAPVLAPHVTELAVYFPKGASFKHYYSGTVYEGGKNVSVPAPFDELAIFKVERDDSFD